MIDVLLCIISKKMECLYLEAKGQLEDFISKTDCNYMKNGIFKRPQHKAHSAKVSEYKLVFISGTFNLHLNLTANQFSVAKRVSDVFLL